VTQVFSVIYGFFFSQFAHFLRMVRKCLLDPALFLPFQIHAELPRSLFLSRWVYRKRVERYLTSFPRFVSYLSIFPPLFSNKSSSFPLRFPNRNFLAPTIIAFSFLTPASFEDLLTSFQPLFAPSIPPSLFPILLPYV